MAKKIEKMKSLSTNVRYVKAKQKCTRFFLSALWHIAPDVTKNMVLKRFFKPISQPLTPIETQYLENATPFHIQVHGNEIRCWEWGRGPGILFVHGWNGRGVNLACFFKPVIDAGYSAITYDAPAHGESGGHVTNYFELSDTVRSFLAPSRGLNIQGIIAHSIGASAVINCISKDKPPVDAVLIAPALKLKELTFNLFNQHGVPEMVYQNMIHEMEGYYGYNLHQDNPYILAKTISSKMLIVHDKNDRTISYSDSKKLSEKTDHVFLHTTRGLGHKRILREKAVVDVATAYIFNEQIQHDKHSMKARQSEFKINTVRAAEIGNKV
jgi:Alpha/beta hydrolase family